MMVMMMKVNEKQNLGDFYQILFLENKLMKPYKQCGMNVEHHILKEAYLSDVVSVIYVCVGGFFV